MVISNQTSNGGALFARDAAIGVNPASLIVCEFPGVSLMVFFDLASPCSLFTTYHMPLVASIEGNFFVLPLGT